MVNVTLDNLGDLPTRCRNCVFWELDPVSGERACDSGAAELEKEAWLSDTLLEWGSCGQLVYVDGVLRPGTSIGSILPSDIVSVEVLKGAAAAKESGDPAAANGVIYITTKHARK